MEYIKTEIRERVLSITLNRPDKRNALSADFVSELIQAFEDAKGDDAVKVIILKAEGKVFSAGADLAYLQQLQQNNFEENYADSSHLKSLFELMYTHPKVIIAQIEGHALAGGCGLATVCDIAISVPEARFGYTEVKIGFIPAIVMYFLLRKIGEGHAKEMLLTGHLINATKAARYGLITEVVDADTIGSHVRHLAENIAESTSGEAVAHTKQMIAQIQSMELSEGLDFAARSNAHARASEDCKRGIAAFLNKEDIKW